MGYFFPFQEQGDHPLVLLSHPETIDLVRKKVGILAPLTTTDVIITSLAPFF